MTAHTTRRGFLGWAGTGTALTALAQLRCLPPAACQAPSGAFFAERERELLTQVVERMVGPGAPAVRDTGAIDVIEQLCAGLPPSLTQPLPTLLRLFDWAPLLFDFSSTRFSRMAPEDRDGSLRAWMTSRIALRRRAFYALRNLAFLGYYSQPSSWAGIGYAGPLLRPGARP